MRAMIRDAGLAVWGAWAAGLLAVSAWQACGDSHDLVYVLDVARMLLNGQDPYRAYLDWRGGVGPMPSYQHGLEGYAPNYLPNALAVLFPLTVLAPETAMAVWALLNIGFALGAAWLTLRLFLAELCWRAQAVTALAFLTSISLAETFVSGQFGLAAMFLFLVAWRSATCDSRAGASLGLAAALMKYTLTGPLALIFLRRNISILAAAAGIHVLIVLGLALHIGLSPLMLIIEALSAARGFTAAGDMDYASLLAFFGDGGLMAGIVLSVVVAVAGIAIFIRRTAHDPLQALAFLCLVSSMIVYHRDYDAVILLLPLAYGVRTWTTKRPLDSATWVAAGAGLIAVGTVWYGVPLARLMHDELPGVMGQAPVVAWAIFALAVSASLAAHMILLWRGPAQLRAPA